MSFEILNIDLNGRIGKLYTKSGVLETPYFFPVINKNKLIITINELKDEFKVSGIMTNAYLIKKEYENKGLEIEDIHKILNFDGIVYTDSGGYQILRYGKIKAEPEDIVEVEEKLNVDIGAILDIPTGIKKDYRIAKESVKKTIENADKSIQKIVRRDILWVGPIQGGVFEELLSLSAREMSNKGFSILALGSPVELMERYDFSQLIKMGVIAKANVPSGIPIHFFGAGHPMILSFLVALGYDIFDSASYALYAYEDRYITAHGTFKLNELSYFPCECNICSKYTPKELKEMEKNERIKLLAKHNLYTIHREIREIKERIKEGTLWDLIEIRSRSHPKTFAAFKELARFAPKIFNESPIFKRKGIFMFDQMSKERPEIVYLRKKEIGKIEQKCKRLILIFIEEDKLSNEIVKKIIENIKLDEDKKCVYYLNKYFGFVPIWAYYTSPFNKIISPEDVLPEEKIEEVINHLVSELSSKEVEITIIRDKSSCLLSEKFIEKLSLEKGIKIKNKIDLG
ncbi:MAG: tRNA guanosine(15) transglycosylase TgtA [Thermoproteota archaeon]|nr:tRNA guanosine(15) transglycosylase TgtA [Candidatus Brockarchaeota archaeon]MBO3768322.1 tRNA guanosine(15) transglycosylase TgtA [Candidatus Brockarchaeota archaeon]MBO3800992.1 tRNA guanosine(15) transglycosylase TgtA [Candidatus Brockarchaeota archaeon]